IRTGDFEHAQRQEDYRRTGDQNPGAPTSDLSPSCRLFRAGGRPLPATPKPGEGGPSALWTWPVLPAQPKEIGDKKRNEPAVAVLFIEAPFFAEMTATNKPECAKSEGEKQNGCSRVSMRRVLARCAAPHRGRFSRVLRKQEEDNIANLARRKRHVF